MSYSRRRYRGNGAYTLEDGPWANRGATLGGFIARGFGMPGAIGSWVGRRLFHYPAKLFGSGAYRKRASYPPPRRQVSTSAYKRRSSGRKRKYVRGSGAYQVTGGDGMRPRPPTFQSETRDDSVVITHREYLGDVISSSTAGAFKIEKYPINPNSLQTFPVLLSQIASAYQQYKFDGAFFEFQSFSADALNSTNTALGSVFACINYDSLDATPSSRNEVENTDWAMAGKPSESFSCGVECARRQTVGGGMLYCLPTPNVPSGADPKTYFLGNFFIGSTGCQGTSVNLGSLYVTYKVRLYKVAPQKPLSNGNKVVLVRSGCTSASPLGTTTATSSTLTSGTQCDTLGITFTSGTVLTIDNSRLQVGARYIVMFNWFHDNGVVVPATVTPSSGLTATSSFPSTNTVANAMAATQVYAPFPSGGTLQASMQCSIFEVISDAVSQTLTLSASTLPANCILNLHILQFSGVSNSTLGIYTP